MILTKVDLEQNFCRPADNEIAVNTEAGLFIRMPEATQCFDVNSKLPDADRAIIKIIWIVVISIKSSSTARAKCGHIVYDRHEYNALSRIKPLTRLNVAVDIN